MLLVIWLHEGECLTTTELATRLGLTLSGAWRLLMKASELHQLPLTFADGKWFLNRD